MVYTLFFTALSGTILIFFIQSVLFLNFFFLKKNLNSYSSIFTGVLILNLVEGGNMLTTSLSYYYQYITYYNCTENFLIIFTFLFLLSRLHFTHKAAYFIFLFYVISIDTSYLQPKANLDLLNGIILTHPVILYIFYTTLISAFCYMYLNFFYFYFFKIFFYSIYINKIISVYAIGFCAVLLGAWWAEQELLWGGWWSWDFIEILSLSLLIILLFVVHGYVLYLTNFSYFFLTLLCVVGIVRFNLINSVHNFILLGDQNQYITYVIIIILLLVVFMVTGPFLPNNNITYILFIYILIYNTLIYIYIYIYNFDTNIIMFFLKKNYLVFFVIVCGFFLKSLSNNITLVLIPVYPYYLCVFIQLSVLVSINYFLRPVVPFLTYRNVLSLVHTLFILFLLVVVTQTGYFTSSLLAPDVLNVLLIKYTTLVTSTALLTNKKLFTLDFENFTYLLLEEGFSYTYFNIKYIYTITKTISEYLQLGVFFSNDLIYYIILVYIIIYLLYSMYLRRLCCNFFNF